MNGDEGGKTWERATYRLALGDTLVPGGRRTKLYSGGAIPGETKGTVVFSQTTHDIAVVATKTLPGTVTPGRPHIVYVEGDQKINFDGAMTVEEFAKANPGNYLVVTVEVR
ncbi:MAG TPA: hypothetical protein VGX78_18195 [Pirellulales bacterium]|nr:hypothetical protein [Pirellulales bacterium]